MTVKPSRYAKAIIGTAIAGLGSASVALEDGAISGQEWITVAIVTLTAAAAVFGIPNAAGPGTGERSNDQPMDT